MLAIMKIKTLTATKLVAVEVKSQGHAALVAKQLDANPNVQHTMLILTDIAEVVFATEVDVTTIAL